MKDIVETALQNAEVVEQPPDDDVPPADEFGTPSCALIGCGSEGIARIEKLEKWTATETIMPRSDRGTTGADKNVRLPLEGPSSPSDLSDTGCVDAAITFNDEIMDADVVAVTAHLDKPSAGLLASRVCHQLSEEQTVFAVPTIPQVGLSEPARDIFLELADAADTTIPCDVARINDAFCRSPMIKRDNPLDIANSLVAEWLEDIFTWVRGSMAAPCLQRLAAYELFDTGNVSMLYWGRGTRGAAPESLLKDAAAHRFCDGDRRTATGGFGFVRFGYSYTLGEFEALKTQSKATLGPENVADGRWVLCGDTAVGFDEEYRFALLLTDITPASLPFL